jgi:hypothetical protein
MLISDRLMAERLTTDRLSAASLTADKLMASSLPGVWLNTDRLTTEGWV